MKQSSKRFLSLIISLLFFVAAFTVYLNLLEPAYSDFESIKAQVIARSNFIKNQQTAIGQIKSLISSYQSESSFQNVVSAALPISPELSLVLAQVSGLAANNGIALSALNASLQPLQSSGANGTSPNPTSSDLVKPVGSIIVDVKASGSYENLKNFIKGLESDVRVLDIKELKVTSLQGKISSDSYSYDLTVASYYQSQ